MTDQPPETSARAFVHLTSEDIQTLQAIKNNIDWLRALACTLARRGAAFRENDPERAREILEVFAPHPFYKAGQFLFDLLELEDFMLDGPPPPILHTALDVHTLNNLASLLRTARSYLESGHYREDSAEQTREYFHADVETLLIDERQLPELKASFYLYHDVVLGLYASFIENVQAPPPTPPPGNRVCVDFNGYKEDRKLSGEFLVLWQHQGKQYLGPTFSPLKDPLQLMQVGDPTGVLKLSFPSSGMRIAFPGRVEEVALTVNNYGGPDLHFIAYGEQKNILDEFTLPIHETVKMVEFPQIGITALEITGGGESSLIEVCYTTGSGG